MRTFGIEIEIENLDGREMARKMTEAGIHCEFMGYTHRVTDHWKVVTDSTVSTGCEIVSPILRSEADFETVRKVLKIARVNHGRIRKTCGVHVHIGCGNLTAQHIANVYNRYRRFERDFDAIQPVSRRENNNYRYCKTLVTQPELEPAHSPLATAMLRSDRFHKVNLCSFVKYGTIEFRHHAGTMNEDKLINWVLFLQDFVEASTPQTTADTCDESGKPKAIVDLLEQAGNGGMRPAEIAALIGSTKGSVMAMVCNLRNRGQNIRTSRGRYILQNVPAANPANDSMMRGVTPRLVSFYRERAAALAS